MHHCIAYMILSSGLRLFDWSLHQKTDAFMARGVRIPDARALKLASLCSISCSARGEEGRCVIKKVCMPFTLHCLREAGLKGWTRYDEQRLSMGLKLVPEQGAPQSLFLIS